MSLGLAAAIAALAALGLVLSIATAGASTSAAPQPAAFKSVYWRHCGDGYPHYNYINLKAHNLGCRYAHRTATHHFKTGDRRFHGWRCHDKMRGEGGRTRCQRRHGRYQELHYVFGV